MSHHITADSPVGSSVDPGQDAAPTDELTIYSTPWCGYCHRLKSQLDRAGINYREVDIEREPAAAEIVEQVNRGNQTVPTLVFPDGSALTNPSLAEIKARLAA